MKNYVIAFIAFPICGTNIYYVVHKIVNISKLPQGFKIDSSCRGYNRKNENIVRLSWDSLYKRDGMPHTDPGWIKRRFNELEKMNWKPVSTKPSQTSIW